MSSENINITPEEARTILWEQGEAWQFLLDDLQKNIVQSFYNSDTGKELILVLGRQTGKCAISTTYVATPTGSVQIKDIKIGDIVYGITDSGQVFPTEVKQVHKQGVKKVVDMMHRGRVIATTTMDHRWLVYDTYSKRLDVKQTRDLLVNKSRYKIKREYFDFVGGDIHEPHAYTLGALLGDGCSKAKGSSIVISSQDDKIPKSISSEVGCFFWKQKGNNYNWILSSEYKVGKGNKYTPLQVNHYDDWCRDRYAHQKTCDYEVIRHWTRESQVRFLAGLIDSDGSVFVTGRNKNELKLTISMQAESVIDTVQKIILDLWQIEVCRQLDNRPKYKNGPGYVAYLNNNFCVKRILKELTPHLSLDRKKYKAEYDSFPEYNHVAEYVGVVPGREYEAETYDLGIDTENHLYLLANGLVTHNSFGLFSLAVCHAIKYGGITVTYVAPTLKMAKKITKMTLNEIISLGSPPKNCIPKFNTQDSEYNFPNGSKIELAGFNGGQIDDARGGKSHIVIVDECGFMDSHEFEYGIKSVLYPKLNSTKGIMLMCSTLPKSASHPYWNRVLLAKLENRLVEGTIYDCPRYTQEDIDKFADRVGGYETVDFKREYLNLMITQEDKAVIPEASVEKMNKIVKEMERPPFYDPYVSMDIGFRDYTAVVYGYYDYLRNTVVIEDESIIRGSAVTTSSIHETIQKKEQELWNAKAYLRVADNNNLILLNELSLPPYSLPILATAKDNREAAINKVRLLIQKETLIINPRCKHLIQQIQNATWNARRTDFDRDVLEGHQDCLAALIYLVRNIHFGRNPYPADYMMTYDTFQVPIAGGFDRPKDDFQKAMKSLFNPLMNRKSI